MAIADDFNDVDYNLFREDNFNTVMYGLNLFDKNMIRKQIDKFNTKMIELCTNNNRGYEYILNELAKTKYISHKKWIEKVRNNTLYE